VNSLEQVFLDYATLSWRLSWLILLLLVLRLPLLRLASPRWCFALWLVVAGALVIPARAPLSLPQLGLDRFFSLPAFEKERAAPDTRTDGPAPAAAPVDTPSAAESRMELTGATELRTPDDAPPATEAWVSGLALLWLGGVVGLLGLRLIAAIRLQRRLTHERSAPVDTALVAAVKAGCVELGVRTLPDIVTTPLVTSPALCGVLRPRLLFPIGFSARLSPEELRWVIRHELGHLRRRDLLSHSLLQLACAVHWFNPLVWLAARLARQDGEMACDDFVLRHARPAEPAAYGRALLSVIGAVRDQSRLPATLGIVENKRQLLTRITMISSHRPQTLRRTLTGAALLSLFALVGYTEEPKPQTASPAPNQGNTVDVPRTDEERRAFSIARQAKLEQWNAAAKVEVRATGTPGGVPIAFLEVNDEPRLVRVGSDLLGARVTEIDSNAGRVTTISRDGQSKRVFDQGDPKGIKLPSFTAQEIERLLSHDHGLRTQGAGLPYEVMSAWPTINREGKIAILMNYLKSGHVVEIAFRPDGMSGSSRRLFAEQLEERTRQRLEAFLAALTPEQRTQFGRGGQMAISLKASAAERANQLERASGQKSNQDSVIASLTPEQRKLYDAWRTGVSY
jgi:beta-lactamase regulating signal transducer with metallopeptidase domain